MEDITELAQKFKNCRQTLVAFGDENRQHLILEMMQMGKCNGVRVGEITEKSNLSRPAVSHHLQILKNAGIIKVRRDGTKNYYYFDNDSEAINNLINMLETAKKVMADLPAKEYEIR